MRHGLIYTETVVHLAAPAFASDAPYQVVIVQLEDGTKVTARLVGERVSIGDRVVETDRVAGAPAFMRAAV